MKTKWWWLGAVLGVLLVASTALADSHARIVRLSYVQGDADINRGRGAGAEDAVLNMPIVEGTELWTRANGEAEVEFEDGSTLRLAPNTRISFPGLTLRDSGARVSSVAVAGGTVYVDVPRLEKGDEVRFLFASREVLLSDAVRMRIDVDSAVVSLAVFKGQLELQGDEHAITVKKNETIQLGLADANRYFLAKGIQPGAYDDWNNDRARYRDQYAGAGDHSWYPYSYGYGDLMQYGSMFSVGGYGLLWRPYNVGMGWTPWDVGQWSWYPGVGYVWVSRHPWGWAPYRFGRWVYVRPYGWCWSSSGWAWDRWNVGPNFAGGLPPNYVPPSAPTFVAGGGVPPTVRVGPRDQDWRRKVVDNDNLNAGPMRGDRPVHSGRDQPSVVMGRQPAEGMSDAGRARATFRDNDGMQRPIVRGRGSDPDTARPSVNMGGGGQAGSSRPTPPAPQPRMAPPAPQPRMDAPRMSQPSAPAPSVHMGGGNAGGGGHMGGGNAGGGGRMGGGNAGGGGRVGGGGEGGGHQRPPKQ